VNEARGRVFWGAVGVSDGGSQSHRFGYDDLCSGSPHSDFGQDLLYLLRPYLPPCHQAMWQTLILDEDPEEEPKEDHAGYPADGEDYDDEPSDDDDDDDNTDDKDEEPFEDEDDDKEEEEYLALADSFAVPIVDPVPSEGWWGGGWDTEAFETNESAPTPRSP
ncbi:hypothetical protein Tco_1223521, partial [Tanacetum coccineum]